MHKSQKLPVAVLYISRVAIVRTMVYVDVDTVSTCIPDLMTYGKNSIICVVKLDNKNENNHWLGVLISRRVGYHSGPNGQQARFATFGNQYDKRADLPPWSSGSVLNCVPVGWGCYSCPTLVDVLYTKVCHNFMGSKPD